MTVVAKLGSSIVAAEDGALRTDVLDQRLRAGRRLHDGGEDVVMVTRRDRAGMRVMGLRAPARDRRAPGGLGRGPGEPVPRLRGAPRRGEVHAAQVLLTASDLQLRTHYLNARQTLRGCSPGGSSRS